VLTGISEHECASLRHPTFFIQVDPGRVVVAFVLSLNFFHPPLFDLYSAWKEFHIFTEYLFVPFKLHSFPAVSGNLMFLAFLSTPFVCSLPFLPPWTLPPAASAAYAIPFPFSLWTSPPKSNAQFLRFLFLTHHLALLIKGKEINFSFLSRNGPSGRNLFAHCVATAFPSVFRLQHR